MRSMQCGDWHLGWGYGGHDKLGRLTLNEDGTFYWKGKSQGRHGRTWNYGAFLHFRLTEKDKMDIIESKGGYPEWSELLQSAKELQRLDALPVPEKRVRKPKQIDNPNQTSLL